MKWFNNTLALALTTLSVAGAGMLANAAPNIGGGRNGKKQALLRTAATCNPAAAAIDLDINNVRARLMTGGDMWWDPGTAEARYEIPKGTKKNSLFAGSLWVGGYDATGTLKVAAQTYRQDGNDYWPGPLAEDNTIEGTTCTEWDRFWKINRADLSAFNEIVKRGGTPQGAQYDAIMQWPAAGNSLAKGTSGAPLFPISGNPIGRDYAPFVDADGDGRYDATAGDYPLINGDQYIWWVFNDAGSVKQQTQTQAIGLEIQASAFAFATNDAMNDASFYNYRLINRGASALNDCWVATWTDADLGDAFDDYIGCDTNRGLGILYNGDQLDGAGQPNSYGTQLPMVGVDFFIGPQRKREIAGQTVIDTLGMEVFNWYNNDQSINGNPRNGLEIYYLMTARNRVGQPLHYTFQGPGVPNTGFGNGPDTKYVFFGDPGNPSEWSECSSGNPPGDRRFVHSAGPFTLEAGGKTNDITIGVVWVAKANGCPTASFSKIRGADQAAQDLFDLGFKLTEGPNAPRMVIREMDRKLVVYLMNDPISNNYKEQYGYNLTPGDSNDKFRVASAKSRTSTDPFYKFEGYRVFQVKNSSISTSEIFTEKGLINNDVAVEIFQTDVANNVSDITNWYNIRDIGSDYFEAGVVVDGKDSGIRRSFVVNQDAFATGAEKRLVNYRNYYFVAVAYAYNNFRPFNRDSADFTQDKPYIQSRSGAKGEGDPLVPIAAMPNPANGDFGTVINSDYGSGVVIKRIEGTGNGGLDLQIDTETETTILTSQKHAVAQPTYIPGMGPVDVKVVDPRKVKAADWELFLTGPEYNNPGLNQPKYLGLKPDSSSWYIVVTPTDGSGAKTIYSERNLSLINEQILEDYGISVAVKQVRRPYVEQDRNNGLITSDITFTDPGKVWLTGIRDGEQGSPLNWIRSGRPNGPAPEVIGIPACGNLVDKRLDTVVQVYEKLIGNNALLTGTWAPSALVADQEVAKDCPYDFSILPSGSMDSANSFKLGSTDIVFTSDRSKWTKCIVVETQSDPRLSQGNVEKFKLRRHASWNGAVDGQGNAIYATDPSDTGYSMFPGYAINQETGERLNIIFGEDSWQQSENGSDMLWNPSSVLFDDASNMLAGGRHYIYVSRTKYDEGKAFFDAFKIPDPLATKVLVFRTIDWVGRPLLNSGFNYLSIKDGLIPTETRLRFRVTRPYASYVPDATIPLRNNGLPLYTFSTRDLALKALTDNDNPYMNDKKKLLDLIRVVPNPYYGYSGYENNRFDTRVRITNLPQRASVIVYSSDGSVVRKLEKDNPNQSYLDWDVRNAKGLPIASGMYLFHVEAEGIGETIVRWFGAMRPIDATQY